MLIFYVVMMCISFICCILYMLRWNKRINLSYTMMMLLIAVSVFGTYIRCSASNVENAYLGNIISYIGACFLQAALSYCILDLCHYEVSRFSRLGLLSAGTIMYAIILTDPLQHWFYSSVSITKVGDVTILLKEYSYFHAVFYAMIIIYFVLNTGFLLFAFLHKKNVSYKTIFMLFVMEFINLFSYFMQKFLPYEIELNVIPYVMSQMLILIMLPRLSVYDVDSTVVNAMLRSNILGCFSFSMKRKYLGCNSICEKWLPELTALRVDKKIKENDQTTLFMNIRGWMDKISDADKSYEFYFTKGASVYKITGGFFCENKKKLGYQFSVRDFTKEQKLVDLMGSYNEELESKVEEKTRNISEMHERMILGMADMVESRDNSTGHHIKRTSQGVRILISRIMENNWLGIDVQFARAVIKAAPMHDLGKITVDDYILRKPGKYEPYEYEIMKGHTTQGAIIVRKLLKDTQDDYFAQIAENVAHYHHEKMDGTGYPYGLVGEQIPLEARIMAIADVYDALVCKRCYKGNMSFEETFQIIMDGMGTHFDKNLESYFVAAREELEEFYRQEIENEE